MLSPATLATSVAVLASSVQAASSTYIKYSTVTGYFLQDVPTTNASTFDYTATNFGLINRTYPATDGLSADLTQWQRFERQVEALNAAADLNTVYKVLFMGRHGEGFHNAAETYYGTPAWNCYWAELNGNGTVTWADADLTVNGIAQAQKANNFWKHELAIQHIPAPQSYYVSPLTRCLRTANITFSGLELPIYYPFVPTIKELFREGISIHTCDHRRNKTYIHDLFPTWNFEKGFKENDDYWNGVTAETSAAQDVRSKKVLDSVFTSDDHTWLSITSHSGEIGSILRVLGHQTFSLSTGAVIPVLVKGRNPEFLSASDAPAATSAPYTTSTHCSSPPLSSISGVGQGCVCSSGVNVTTPLITLSSAPTSCTATSSKRKHTHITVTTAAYSHHTSNTYGYHS
ncbi:putative phosphoglycerate mutase [Acrodontium crateriforme]|uniref:Phosphoglycerate mutase n=1 Tax=Acrodontium crateriforme TaxID=150365 RepID=A0AAQ3M881_9PEZI|nr:putative phosphoglycerate mutase [Acrodontium crateriforme]